MHIRVYYRLYEYDESLYILIKSFSGFFFLFLFLDMSGKGPSPIQKALDSARTDRKIDSATLNAAKEQYISLKATTDKLNFEDNKEVKTILNSW